jgi:hypothetical protein
LVSAATRYVLDRRSEHAQGRAIARLLYRELEDIRTDVDTTREEQEPWQGDDLGSTTWRDQRYKIAGELDETELLTLSAAMGWIAQANAWRIAHINGRRRRWRQLQPRMFTEDDDRFLFIVSSAVGLACDAIGPLRRGRKFFMFRRRVPRALAPNLGLRCECGHAFGRHAWRTRRRWLRLTKPLHSHHDVAGHCRLCGCRRLTYPDSSQAKRALRRLRLLPRAPYSHQTPPAADIEGPDATHWRPSTVRSPGGSTFIRDRS